MKEFILNIIKNSSKRVMGFYSFNVGVALAFFHYPYEVVALFVGASLIWFGYTIIEWLRPKGSENGK